MRVQFKDWDCEVKKIKYTDNGRTALSLIAWADDPKEGIFKGEPIAMATVNIPECPLGVDEVIIKDYSENEGMLECLLKAGIIELTGVRVQTGFVECPVCVLNWRDNG